jgi:hypothetical protein
MAYPVENAVLQWEDGYRSLEGARSDPSRYRRLGRVVMAVEDGLRKRLGSTFSIAELAAVYREAPDWTLDLTPSKPGEPVVDAATAVDAAFYLYMREAADFAGGRPVRH